jgi:hypothetical protein
MPRLASATLVLLLPLPHHLDEDRDDLRIDRRDDLELPRLEAHAEETVERLDFPERNVQRGPHTGVGPTLRQLQVVLPEVLQLFRAGGNIFDRSAFDAFRLVELLQVGFRRCPADLFREREEPSGVSEEF